MHALFNNGEATNSWSIYPQILKEYSDFFGPKTEQLDIFLDDDETIHFVSFTEKVLNSKKGASGELKIYRFGFDSEA